MITRNTDYSIQRLRGLSTDTKPTVTPNGSEFREMDTGKDFMYDAASGAWKEQPTSGASGGGGGGAFVVRKSNGALDKTFAEIKSAVDSGMIVMLHYLEYSSLINIDRVKYLTYLSVSGDGGTYSVIFTHGDDEEESDSTFQATSENGTLEPLNP